MSHPVHAVQVNFFLDPRRAPQQIMRDWWALTIGAGMVAGAGARVTVIQACREAHALVHDGIVYHFVVPARGAIDISGAPLFAQLLRQLEPDIVHVHGLGFGRAVLELRRLLPTRVPIYLQDHADRVPRFWRRAHMRDSFAAAAGVSFCALDQAAPFVRARLLPAPRAGVRTSPQVYEIPEASSPFTAGDRETARGACGIHGSPALLWVGHLDPNKDPLTVLRGARLALERLPDLQLWCCYGSAPLDAAVRSLLGSDPRLSTHVHLLGRLEHSQVQTLMRAADVFVLGSHREGSGFSLIEAMATGLSPVVTDIPSFRSLTGDARVGALWRRGDPADLCRALLDVARRDPALERSRVLQHFASRVSPHAVGEQFLAAYRSMIAAQA